jgi:hypothetical protein
MSKFKIYQFSYDALWLGGTILVAAETEEQARAAAAAEVHKNKYNPETLELTDTTPITA